ncbi:hypothetical protein [Pectobacterium odoriferum]|uniref:hypothetical protein n=1 Tax=Pectobacterium odoriferum TaxID=78398 RepID=UPI001C0F0591|nr:hypothetical protein [Pectobacterium odoriferum]
MKKPAYYKEGVPYDVRGQVITALSGGSTQAPLVTDLGAENSNSHHREKPVT